MRIEVEKVAVIAAWLALAACGETEPAGGDGGGGTGAAPTGVAGGGGGGGGGAAGGAGGAGSCNDLVNDAPEVVVTDVAEVLPAAVGGRIEDGRYHLTAIQHYTGPGGSSGPTGSRQKETSVYAGTELQVVVDLYQGEGEQHVTLDVDADEQGAISFIGVCPGPLSFPFDRYTFTAPATLALYYTQSDLELVYTRVGDR